MKLIIIRHWIPRSEKCNFDFTDRLQDPHNPLGNLASKILCSLILHITRKVIMTTFFTRLSSVAAISIATFSASNIANANLNSQFSSCAAKAIESQSISAKKISVELPSTSAQEMDHSASPKIREYQMGLVNPKSGEELARISCRVTKSGQVQSVTYLSKA